jgi:RNA polymerase sigma factor (TIGR02999 family)
MSDVTRILQSIEDGDPQAAEELLPLVYDELRKLAAAKMKQEKPGQTLQATALVHDAYVRLVDVDQARHWDSRGHFFSAAAEAMRRILVEQARHKSRQRRGGGRQRVALVDTRAVFAADPDDLLSLDEALSKLADDDPLAADVARLRFFAGLSVDEAAASLGISRAAAYRHWTYGRAWLRAELQDGPTED